MQKHYQWVIWLWVNTRYDLDLSKQNWSDWVTKADANYDSKGLFPLIERFQKLKTPKSKAKIAIVFIFLYFS